MTHPTDDEIMELAGAWFHTGENQKRDDGYYYRSLGTPSNVRGSDLIEFARALLAEQAKDAAEDAELLDWLDKDDVRLMKIGANWYTREQCGAPFYKAKNIRAAIRAARAAERKA